MRVSTTVLQGSGLVLLDTLRSLASAVLTVKEGCRIDTLVVGVLVRRDIIHIDKTVLYD